MENQFNQLASILDKNIICKDEVNKDRTKELVKLCNQNGIQINFEKIESSNTYAFSWAGRLSDNKGVVMSMYDCPLANFSDDDYYVSWNLFCSMASGTYMIKTKKQYMKIIEEREKIRRRVSRGKMIAHWDWLSTQEHVNLTCIM